jgi:hypothetical protein
MQIQRVNPFLRSNRTSDHFFTPNLESLEVTGGDQAKKWLKANGFAL